jgi:sugar/nucleoside kinase (ribokinase family)
MPASWRGTAWLLLAPVAGEVTASWADAVAAWHGEGGSADSPAPAVAVAWQGLLRGLEPERPVEHLPARADPLFAIADIASVSSEDLRAGSDDLGTLVPGAGQELVVTSGAGGPLHLRRHSGGFDVRAYPIVPVPEPVDTTGAGDAFLVGWLIARIRGGSRPTSDEALAAEMLAAATLASLTVQGAGLVGVPDAAAVRGALAAVPLAE